MGYVAKRLIGWINTYARPSHLRIISRDLFRLTGTILPARDHLRAVMEWLCRAQDATGCGGVSRGYHLDRGWGPPYPETTGYIVPTFLRYARWANDDNYVARALRMGEWEIEMQLPSGGIREGMGDSGEPVVFDTGQAIFGWADLYQETGMKRFQAAAVRAADWLTENQDNNGSWSRYAYMNIPHTYHTRVAWSLLEVYRLTGDERYRAAAKKNIGWTLAQAEGNGWFRDMGFTRDEAPLTHTIAYTLRGLLESSGYLEKDERSGIEALVRKPLENILLNYRSTGNLSGLLPARLNRDWKSEDTYSCLVGDAQISILWLKLSRIDNDLRFFEAGSQLIDRIKATQSLDSGNPGIRGGIAGSYPIWGKYIPFAYTNWSAKFFADALILQMECI